MLCSRFALLLLITNSIIANKINTNGYPKSENTKIHCAADISNRNFDFREQTVVLSNDVDEFHVNSFLKLFEGTVIVEMKKDGTSVKQAVIMVNTYFSFINIFGKLKPDLKGKAMLHSGVKLIIVINSYPHKIERIISLLWNLYVINVVIIIDDIDKNISLYTYFPYNNPLSCRDLKPSLIGSWDDVKILQKELYPDKMSNMQGCPLYVSTDKLFHPVTDQKVALQMVKKTIIRLLRDVMNFTPIITNRDYVNIDSDRTNDWSDSLSDVLLGTANISTCTVSFGIERVGLFDYTNPYFRIRLAWLAPPPAHGPVWWRLFSPLNGYLWLVLLFSVIIIKSLPFIIKFKKVKRFCRNHFRNFDQLRNVAFRSWGVMMGQSIRVAPRRFRDFYIISLWIWFTFVVRSAYQSVLIGALKSDILVGKFITIKEAVDHGYKFGGRDGILSHFEHEPFIRDGFIIVPENKYMKTFQEVLEGNNKFILAMFLEYAWAYCLTQGLTEAECGYTIPDSIMKIPLVVWMKKHSPFKKSSTLWIERFLESGLLQTDAMTKPLTNSLKVSEPSPLTWNQMLSCVMCLFLGYIVSIITFVLEMMKFKTKQIQESKNKKHVRCWYSSFLNLKVLNVQ